MAKLSFPAAPAVRMWTSGKAVAAALSLSAERRDTCLLAVMTWVPFSDQALPAIHVFSGAAGDGPRQRLPWAGVSIGRIVRESDRPDRLRLVTGMVQGGAL